MEKTGDAQGLSIIQKAGRLMLPYIGCLFKPFFLRHLYGKIVDFLFSKLIIWNPRMVGEFFGLIVRTAK